jgi:NADPH:quinone reductase-like Zn-dependent oxidoreductase
MGETRTLDDSNLMDAIVQRRYGSADTWHLTRSPVPVAGPEEVLVRVHAAGVHRGTWHLMTGRPRLLRVLGFGLRRPRIPVPGTELAGIVAAIGSGVTHFAVGDRVYGIGRGTFAELAVAREDKLANMPKNLSFAEAATVPISALTAHQALRSGQLGASDRVLILGASGGVGAYAVQLAKRADAEVTGVCGTGKIAFVRDLGADHVLDYTREDSADTGHRYDLLLDLAGNPSLTRLRQTLTPTGTAVIVGGEEGGNWTGGIGRQLRAVAISALGHQTLRAFATKETATDLQQLTQIIEAGHVQPRLGRIFALGQAPEAMRHLESGEVQGKVAIQLID